MNTTLVKYASLVGSIAGFLAGLNEIKGVSPKISAPIIGLSVIVYKICDILENKKAAQ